MKPLSRVRLFVTPWTVAYQASPSMGFSRQEYWSGLPFPSPGDLPDPGIEPVSPALEADALTSGPPGKHLVSKSCPILCNPIDCSTPGRATSLPCPSLSPRVCSDSCSLSHWCCLTILSSVALFSFCLGKSCRSLKAWSPKLYTITSAAFYW